MDPCSALERQIKSITEVPYAERRGVLQLTVCSSRSVSYLEPDVSEYSPIMNKIGIFLKQSETLPRIGGISRRRKKMSFAPYVAIRASLATRSSTLPAQMHCAWVAHGPSALFASTLLNTLQPVGGKSWLMKSINFYRSFPSRWLLIISSSFTRGKTKDETGVSFGLEYREDPNLRDLLMNFEIVVAW